ncbi:tRNA pseudouridine synthase-like 1 [Xenopus laevis]|uniref:tRNA pseudouridine synthase-like 1 n=1 Tax=Xenopus laevis TaxID=8355 RepID=PUSL1_XENLA|nr:tRNA pseudouridine synthase-like 1 [Xenopus laevis]Q6GQ53.1 RecName: Full=tRNA pseudouridine synthase-like 1; AltName: Full=tRNA pseudouridylate synthase-like 1; AltName: Full=tRNA-uridine isomerase-like 1 [Xenopus laevis]AAH72895.1 MGC80334 protein [Xenopus laevis]
MHSSKARYLVFFQYYGTKYSGVMETPITQSVLGVQNYLEVAAQKLRPVGTIKFFISSRTDSGVHAICNLAHVDIERAKGKPPFTEEILVQAMNHHLQPEPIRLLKAIRVCDNFHARHNALSRTYVYRVAAGCSRPELPVFEGNLCWAIQDGLNVTAINEASKMLLGTHNFSAFRSANSENAFKSPIKTLQQADINPSCGILTHHWQSRNLQFWDFTFRARSFLYKQVRRMTGALVAVGQGRLTPQQIKEFLENQDPNCFLGNFVAPPHGLFLKDVEYDGTELNGFSAEETQKYSSHLN